MSAVTTKTTDILMEGDTYIEHSIITIFSALHSTFCPLSICCSPTPKVAGESHSSAHTHRERTCAARPLLLSHYFMMCIYMYTYMYICTHICVRIYMLAHKHTHTRKYMLAHNTPNTQTHAHAHAHAHAHIRIRKRTRTQRQRQRR